MLKIYILLAALVMIFLPGRQVCAEENFTSEYNQNEFSEEDGFESGQANCICQSTSGYIWVGTDSGLYRYDGSGFTLVTLDNENDGSSYCINCIMLSQNGKLYIGTENYGLFVYHAGLYERVSATYNLGISTINDMYEDAEGIIWLATNEGIYMLDEDELKLVENETFQKADITAIAGYETMIYAIANNDSIVQIQDGIIKNCVSKSEYFADDLNCLYIDANGCQYYGTAGRNVLKINPDGTSDTLNTGSLRGINKIVGQENCIWVLADDGVAYFMEDGSMQYVTGLEFSGSMSDMIVDFEGNYWFTSYRKGLLFLEKSKFKNVSMTYGLDDSIVNCVIEHKGQIYIGTDDGLTIIGKDGKLVTDSELAAMLSGVSIRDLYVDSSNNLWICTYRIYGVIKVTGAGTYQYYNKSEAGLISNAVNCICELENGSMAIGTESGISYLKNGKVIENFSRSEGIENADIISLYQSGDGILYAGSNGAGMYSIDTDSNVKQITVEEGLKFNVIYSITGGSNGLWIGTDNGLFYQEGVIRQISAVDPSNSIYDIIIDEQGYLWMFGSRGILRYYENDLLSSAQPEVLSFSKNNGIISDISEASANYISKEGMVYVCCDQGLCSINMNDIYINEVAPQVRISSVSVDGIEYEFSELDGKISVPGNTNRITIKFAVLSYVNRADIQVKYYLEGFEDEYRVLSGNDLMEVEYTNLEGGNYKFVLTAENADGIPCEQAVSFTIQKQLEFWKTDLWKILVTCGSILLLLLLIAVFRMIDHVIKKKNQQVEELSKKNEETVKSNQAKNDYVNYLSHEIRAPLNSILAISEILLRDTKNQSEEENNQISMMYESCYEILGIVEGISKLSNLQDGSIELSNKEYAVSDVIEELAVQFKTMINRELIELKVSIEDDIPNGLVGDVAQIKELITNIYSRAVSTTKEGYISIEIDWRKCEKESSETTNEDDASVYDEIYLDFIISDSGIGVKEERLDSFFEIDDSYDKDDVGKFDISVGLAIARELIRMMDGDAQVSSTYGAGATIRFSIKQAVFDYSYVNYNTDRKKELARRDSNSRIWLPDVRILLVDDSEVVLQAAKALFDSYELICDTVTSGFDAIDKIMVHQYDIVFINMIMPVMDGRDTVREIRNLDGEEYSRIPIIAMSETNVDASRDDILSSGFDEILVKPLEVDEIEGIFKMFIPQSKIKEKTSDIKQYINASRFKDDVWILSKYISVEDALKMVGGNFDTFNKFVAAYKEDYEEAVAFLNEYIDDDVRKYRHIIHDIKSSSGNIGAFTVERKAANLESAINIGNMQYARENTKEFVSMMKGMFKSIEKYLASIYQEELPAEKEFKESINRAKMKEIRAYLKEGQAKPVKELMEDIERYTYNEIDTEFLTALKLTIEAMDYQGASEIIDQYLNSI